MRKLLVVGLVCFCILPKSILGQEVYSTDTVVKQVLSLSSRLIIYDDDRKEFIAMNTKEISQSRTFSFFLNPEEIRTYLLNINSLPSTTIFVDNVLVRTFSKEQVVTINFADFISPDKKQPVLITLYFPKKVRTRASFSLVHQFTERQANARQETAEIVRRTQKLSSTTTFAIISLILLLFVILIKQFFPRHYNMFFSFYLRGGAARTDQNIYTSPLLGRENLAVIGTTALILGMIVQFYAVHIPDWKAGIGSEIMRTLNRQTFLAGVLFNAGVTIVFLVVRFYLINLLCRITENSRLSSVQFFEYLRVISITSLLMFVFVFFVGLFPIALKGFLNTALIIGLILLIGRITFTVIKNSNFRNVLLFSYICTTELVPTVILVIVLGTW